MKNGASTDLIGGTWMRLDYEPHPGDVESEVLRSRAGYRIPPEKQRFVPLEMVQGLAPAVQVSK
jgi:hypothetical protein